MTVPYEVVWTRPAKRAITNELPEAVAAAAIALIIGPLSENPQQLGKRLKPPLDDLWSARRATYRILYRIDDERHTIIIETIRHRGSAYR